MARRVQLKANVGERLLSSKLQILRGSGPRRPGLALSILTGRGAAQLESLQEFYAAEPMVARPFALEPVELLSPRRRPRYQPRTVYLSEQHMQDIAVIIALLSTSQLESGRMTRSAVVRRAVEELRVALESDPAKFSVRASSPCPRF